MRNDKRCENAMNTYLQMDKHRPLPINVIMHLLFCKKCRTQVRMLNLAEMSIKEPLFVEVPLTDSSIVNIMSAIVPEYKKQIYENDTLKPLSLSKWIISGAVMILSTLVFAFTNNFVISNSTLVFWTYLFFGFAVIAYCSLFIFCNMDFFVKKLSQIKLLQQ